MADMYAWQDALVLAGSIRERMREERFQSIWPDFKPYPFAFFDRENVYLCGHPNPPGHFAEKGGVHVGPWDPRFVANTFIELEREPTAILDLSTVRPDMEPARLFAMIVHEMFHAYQKSMDYRRWSNEWLYMVYPQLKENIAHRIAERRALLRALLEKNSDEKRNRAAEFIGHREYRRALIKECLDYELGHESYEGLAFYVESKAFEQESGKGKEAVLEIFFEDFEEQSGTLYHLRRSCYAAGMAIARLLDDLFPGWQGEFLETSGYLYDFFAEKIGRTEPISDTDPEAEKQAARLLEQELTERDREFDQFYSQDGYLVQIKGNLTIAGFDPMNLLPKGELLLHKRMLKFSSNNKEYFLEQPVVTIMNGGNLSCRELQFFSRGKPEIKDGKASVPGLTEELLLDGITIEADREKIE